jgi:hypothetical protein
LSHHDQAPPISTPTAAWNTLMLTSHNPHPAPGGIPPTFSTDPPRLYIGYFEKRHGEQWILTFHHASREARLRGEDIGSASAYPVRDGRIDGLILAPEEVACLQACWDATRASPAPRRARSWSHRPARGDGRRRSDDGTASRREATGYRPE